MAKICVNEKKVKGHINPEIYGQFSEHVGKCIYGGLYVGENSSISNENGMRKDVVEALKKIKVPVLRWPGGCFADEYHWMDGIGPKEKRKRMVNTHWGGVEEDNSFGTHEFFELCRQLGCKTYVNGNLGSGTVEEMGKWVEYITFDGFSPMANMRKENGHEKPWKIDYFGIGNENWGCGGNMTPEYYGNLYRRYQTYVRDYDKNHTIKKICCGANAADFYWTENVLKTCFAQPQPGCDGVKGFMNLMSFHYYVHPEGWEIKGSATDFDEEIWYKSLWKALYMEELIIRHGAIMDQYDPEKNIGMAVDEWGCWFTVEPGTNPGFLYQQNTMRDALVAGLTLNIFNKHCDRVKMACLAQIVNVLQAVILTEGEKMLLTPTYHVFHMYRSHQDADLVDSHIINNKYVGIGQEEYAVPKLQESVSVDNDGIFTLTLINLSATESEKVEVAFIEHRISRVCASILTQNIHAFNTFDRPEKVTEQEFSEFTLTEKGFVFIIPACSVVSFRIEISEGYASR